MVIYTPREIDFSTFPESDGEPMAETIENAIQMSDLMVAFRALMRLQGRTQFAVGGNQFLYYNEHHGWDHCSPDVYVALDVPPGPRPKWLTWVEGKCPDIVFEITSPSTQDEDLGRKRALYARLEAQEYYIYDPQQALEPPLRAYQLVAGVMEERPLLPSGGIHSPLLGVELRPMGQYLRVIDPTSGQPLPTIAELEQRGVAYEEAQAELAAAQQQLAQEEQARRMAEQRVAQEEQARRRAEDARHREEQARRSAEQRVAQEEQARRAAEQRAAQAEAALQALLDAGQAHQDSPPDES